MRYRYISRHFNSLLGTLICCYLLPYSSHPPNCRASAPFRSLLTSTKFYCLVTGMYVNWTSCPKLLQENRIADFSFLSRVQHCNCNTFVPQWFCSANKMYVCLTGLWWISKCCFVTVVAAAAGPAAADQTVAPDQTTIITNDAEAFALGPIDATTIG